MRRNAVIVLGLMAACGLDDVGGEDPAALGDGCVLDSDCEGELVCVFERCHVECETSVDCPLDATGTNERCMLGDRPTNVCQLDEERHCVYDSECPGKEVCAVDEQCRDKCVTDVDCVQGQVCADGVCAAPEELVNGEIPPAGDVPEGQPCTHNSQCDGALLCVGGKCLFECVKDSDCASDLCVDNTCVPQPQVGPCVPGHQIECACDNGNGVGAQVCAADGVWGACGPCDGGGGAGGGPVVLPCETAPPNWVLQVDGATAYGFAVSNAGAVAVAGLYGGGNTINLGGADIPPFGNQDGFLALYDADMNHVFSGGIGDPAPLFTERVTDVAFDSLGNVLIVGWKSDPATLSIFGGPALPFGMGYFVAKLDGAGTHLWSLAGPNDLGVPCNITRPRMAIGPDDSVAVTDCEANNNGTMMVAKYDTLGNPVAGWPKYIGTVNYEFVRDVAIDASNNVIIVGSADSAGVDFGGGPLGPGALVAKYDANGNHLDSVSFPVGVGVNEVDILKYGAAAVKTDGAGNVYITGMALVPVDFGGGVLPAGAFVVKLDASLAHVWSKSYALGDSLAQSYGPETIDIDEDGNVVVAGAYEVAAAAAVGTCDLPASSGTRDAFIVRLDGATGDSIWTKPLPGSDWATVWALAAAGGHVFADVVFANPGPGTIDLGDGPQAGNSFLVRMPNSDLVTGGAGGGGGAGGAGGAGGMGGAGGAGGNGTCSAGSTMPEHVALPIDNAEGTRIAADDANDVVVSCQYGPSSADLTSIGGPLLPGGFDNSLVLGLTGPTMQYDWHYNYDGSFAMTVTDVDRLEGVPNSDVLVIGQHQDPGVLQDTFPETTTTALPGTAGTFISRIDETGGNQVLVKHIPGADIIEPLHVSFGQFDNNIVVAGHMAASGSVDFGAGAVVNPVAAVTPFLASYTHLGVLQNVTLFPDLSGNNLFTEIHAMHVDHVSGIVGIAGELRGEVDFGGAMTLTAQGRDAFYAIFNSQLGALTHMDSARFGDAMIQLASDIVVYSASRHRIAGLFEGSPDFGGGALPNLGGGLTAFQATFQTGVHQDSTSLFSTVANLTGVQLGMVNQGSEVVGGAYDSGVLGEFCSLDDPAVDSTFLAHFGANAMFDWAQGLEPTMGSGGEIRFSKVPNPRIFSVLADVFSKTYDLGLGPKTGQVHVYSFLP